MWSVKSFSVWSNISLCVTLREALKPPCRTPSSYHRSRRSTSPSCTRRTPTSARSSPPSPMAWLRSAPPGRGCRCRTARPRPQSPPTTAGRAAPPPTSRQTASQSPPRWPRSRPWSSSWPKCRRSSTTRCSTTQRVRSDSGLTKTRSHWCW